LVKDGVTSLFCVKKVCHFQNAISYWSHSRQNGQFGHNMAKCEKNRFKLEFWAKMIAQAYSM